MKEGSRESTKQRSRILIEGWLVGMSTGWKVWQRYKLFLISALKYVLDPTPNKTCNLSLSKHDRYTVFGWRLLYFPYGGEEENLDENRQNGMKAHNQDQQNLASLPVRSA